MKVESRGTLRESVLSDVASRAATDLEFLRRARKDLEGTLARNGYHLTEEELRLVEGFRRRTAGISDEELARTLASGLELFDLFHGQCSAPVQSGQDCRTGHSPAQWYNATTG